MAEVSRWGDGPGERDLLSAQVARHSDRVVAVVRFHPGVLMSVGWRGEMATLRVEPRRPAPYNRTKCKAGK